MKKLIVMIMLLLPLGIGAQEVKIAVVNQSEIYDLMPETTKMEAEIAAIMEMYATNYQKFNDEHNQKYADFYNKQDSLPENIKVSIQQDLLHLQDLMQNLEQSAYQEREAKYAELFAPIQAKMQKAIDQVGEENGYSLILILDPRIVLYMGKSTINATDMVKAKLGLK